MPCDDRSPRSWVRVRHGSVFELALMPSDQAYAQHVQFITNPGRPDEETESWSREEVSPGPGSKTLEAGNDYEVQVLLTFLGPGVTSVEVHARIVRPDGETPHGRPFCERHAGRNGDPPAFSLLSIFMRPQ